MGGMVHANRKTNAAFGGKDYGEGTDDSGVPQETELRHFFYYYINDLLDSVKSISR